MLPSRAQRGRRVSNGVGILGWATTGHWYRCRRPAEFRKALAAISFLLQGVVMLVFGRLVVFEF